MNPTTAQSPKRRSRVRSLNTAGRALLFWALITAACNAFLPYSIWSTVRWVLAAALLIEVIVLVGIKCRRQA